MKRTFILILAFLYFGSSSTVFAKPPGLTNKGSLPHGLQMQNKVPKGWSKGQKKGWNKTRTKKKIKQSQEIKPPQEMFFQQ